MSNMVKMKNYFVSIISLNRFMLIIVTFYLDLKKYWDISHVIN